MEMKFNTPTEILRSIRKAVVPTPASNIVVVANNYPRARALWVNTEGDYLFDFFGLGASAWAVSTDYAKGDIVTNDGFYYMALEAHTSDDSAFAEDIDSWQKLGQIWIPFTLAPGLALFQPQRIAKDNGTGAPDTWDNSDNDIVLIS